MDVTDKSWRTRPRASLEYEAGVDEFIKFAIIHAEDVTCILCPCKVCKNFESLSPSEVKDHMIEKGIDMTYDPFYLHGEEVEEFTEEHSTHADEEHANGAEIFEMLQETLDSNKKDFPSDAKKKSKLEKMIKDAEKLLYGGCTKYNKLDAVVALYSLKANSGMSNKYFSDLLKLLKDMLPEDNVIPKSTNSARSLLRKFDLDYQEIHACVNDCILYRGDHVNEVSCPKCKASRWKTDPHTKKIRENVPAKVLRYFPIIPRFKRMFQSAEMSKKLRWHASNKSNDGVMRHPVDTPAWKRIDSYCPAFKDDPRNLRLGLAADGVNPHRNLSSRYSCWPVMLAIYNLPPWLCMKKEYIMLTLLILGPKQPGNDIDVYLQPLIDDLLLLWNEGVTIHDAVTNLPFTLKAVLMWTINDFPAYGNLAGCATKGRVACPKCGVNTWARWLKHSRKFSYMGSRRFLLRNHRFRLKKSWFDGKQELGEKPIDLNGTEVWDQVKNIQPDWGKCKAQKKRKRTDVVQMWKKKSIFFQLPYWEHLLLRHNLDVMHIEKNICESLLGTLLNMKGKSKDGLKARQDLEEMGIRPDLHPKKSGNKTLLPAALCKLSNSEKKVFCERLKQLKLPDGYCSNISHRVSLSDYTIKDLKSHDCHVLMQQLLSVALRDLLPKGPRDEIFRLCLFYNERCQRTIDRVKMESLEDEVILTMCLLERFFPPSFFDIMVHLTIHLVREACIAGPVQFRWMYPFERYMKDLKAYVRNHARPEGCMAECYLAEESVRFCEGRLGRVENSDVGNGRNEDNNDGSDILEGKPLLKGTPVTLSEEMLDAAYRSILFNFEEVQPYLEKHQKELIRQDPRLRKNEGALRIKHAEKFIEWFKSEIQEEKKHTSISNTLDWLAYGPSMEALSYEGYLINGHRFHTKNGEKGTQNSGVSLSANTLCRSSAKDARQVEKLVTYYGVIRQIFLLDFGDFHYPVFNCDWANVGTGIKVEDGFTLVNLHQGISNNQDPFILATQAQPVFYSRDSSRSSWYVVLRAPPRGFHNLPEDIENELGNVSTPSPISNMEPFDDIDDVDDADEREDCEGTWIVKKKKKKNINVTINLRRSTRKMKNKTRT